MRATIRHKAIILTEYQRDDVSIMAEGCIAARVLPLRCFLCILSDVIHL